MTEYLANNRAFPIVTAPKDVVPALRKAFVRAVILRDPSTRALDQRLQEAIILPETTSREYWDFTRIPGFESYYGNISAEEIEQEADLAEIIIDPNALDALTERLTDLHRLFNKAFHEYAPQPPKNYGSKLLFAKKDGVVGRALTPHTDCSALIGHFTIAGAPINMYTGPHSEEVLHLLNQVRDLSDNFENLDEDEDTQYQILLKRLIQVVDDNNASAEIGDMIFMKGFDPDIEKPPRYMQEEAACIHRSNPRIPELGQAAMILW